jgi:hypothetical protein
MRTFLVLIFAALFTVLPAASASAQPHAAGHHAGLAPPAAPATAPEHHDEPRHDDERHAGAHDQVVRIGIEIASLSKFEVGPGSFQAEFYVTAHCSAEPCEPDLDVTNGKITGKERLLDDKLHQEYRVRADLTGFVDLSEFPFDSHVLPITLVDKNLGSRLELDAAETKLDPAVRLPGWDIQRVDGKVETHVLDATHRVTELEFSVQIGRPKISGFFKSIVPAIFMIFVMGFTLMLKPKSAASRLTAATGGLMTVVMFHVSATAALPPLGYLTRLDKFLIATYFVYLVNIAFSVAMVRFDEKKNERAAELMYATAAGVVPGMGLLVWLLVFLRVV